MSREPVSVRGDQVQNQNTTPNRQTPSPPLPGGTRVPGNTPPPGTTFPSPGPQGTTPLVDTSNLGLQQGAGSQLPGSSMILDALSPISGLPGGGGEYNTGSGGGGALVDPSALVMSPQGGNPWADTTSGPSESNWVGDSSSDEEYTFSGVRLKGRSRGSGGDNPTSHSMGLGKKVPSQAFPLGLADTPGLLLHPDDRYEDDTPQETRRRHMELVSGSGKATAAMRNGQSAPRVDDDGGGGALHFTQWTPSNNPDQRHHRSAHAVYSMRQKEQETYGTKPRLVRDPTTGFLLPRDMMPTTSRSAGGGGGPRTNHHGTAGGGSQYDRGGSATGHPPPTDLNNPNVDVEGTTTHFKRSVDIMQELRNRRLMQMVEDQAHKWS